jgi:hypothetical protein
MPLLRVHVCADLVGKLPHLTGAPQAFSRIESECRPVCCPDALISAWRSERLADRSAPPETTKCMTAKEQIDNKGPLKESRYKATILYLSRIASGGLDIGLGRALLCQLWCH